MGIANINYKKSSIIDFDFTGNLRLPVEAGGRAYPIGVFIRYTENGQQYLSIKFMDLDSVHEDTRMFELKKIEEKYERLKQAEISEALMEFQIQLEQERQEIRQEIMAEINGMDSIVGDKIDVDGSENVLTDLGDDEF